MSQTLSQRADQIQNETVKNANTASRVGSLLKDMCDQFDTAYINYFDFSSMSVTTVAQTNTWYKLNTTTTEGFSRDGLVHSNNRVTWTGSGPAIFRLSGIISVESGNTNQIHVAFFKNEQLWPCSEQIVTTSGVGKANNIAFHCLVELTTNNFIEVFVKNATATTAITLDNVNIIIEQL